MPDCSRVTRKAKQVFREIDEDSAEFDRVCDLLSVHLENAVDGPVEFDEFFEALARLDSAWIGDAGELLGLVSKHDRWLGGAFVRNLHGIVDSFETPRDALDFMRLFKNGANRLRQHHHPDAIKGLGKLATSCTGIQPVKGTHYHLNLLDEAGWDTVKSIEGDEAGRGMDALLTQGFKGTKKKCIEAKGGESVAEKRQVALHFKRGSDAGEPVDSVAFVLNVEKTDVSILREQAKNIWDAMYDDRALATRIFNEGLGLNLSPAQVTARMNNPVTTSMLDLIHTEFVIPHPIRVPVKKTFSVGWWP